MRKIWIEPQSTRAPEKFENFQGSVLWCSGALWFLFFLFPFVLVRADDATEASENLRRVRSQIEREEDRLNSLKKNQTELETAAAQLTAEASRASEKKATILSSVDQIREELDRVTRAVGKIQQDISDRRDGLRKRVVALYKTQRQTAALDYLFHARSSTDLLKRARYLSSVANFDRNYLQGLNKLVESVAHDQERLNTLQQQKQESLSQAEALEKELTKKREEKAQLAAEQRDKVRQQEKSLDKLRASAAKFEQLIASLTGGEKYQPPPEDKTTEATSSVPGPQPTAPEVIVSPFNGAGLGSLKGRLSFPVQGEVIQRFGKQKHDEFADMLFVKGLEVHAPVGAKVSAVAPGKVVLSQVLPGYGNVVIVDHGERYYTLYGRLASSLKAVGDVVKSGEPLAVLGEADYKGRNFYFELRIKGKATNPLDFFKNPPKIAPAAPAPVDNG